MISASSDRKADDNGASYIPSIDYILGKIGLESKPEPDYEIRISYRIFEFLLSGWVSQADFDEKYYLRKNPDVAEALEKRTIISAEDHFRTRGYFEGRAGAQTKVDRDFYRKPPARTAAASDHQRA